MRQTSEANKQTVRQMFKVNLNTNTGKATVKATVKNKFFTFSASTKIDLSQFKDVLNVANQAQTIYNGFKDGDAIDIAYHVIKTVAK